MKLTDGSRIVEIKLYDENGIDGAIDYFVAGSLQYDGETDTYKVEDIDYCISYAKGEEDQGEGWGGDILIEELEPMSEAEALAREFRSTGEWVPEWCEELCKLAGVEDEYAAASADTAEKVLFRAAEILGVEIL